MKFRELLPWLHQRTKTIIYRFAEQVREPGGKQPGKPEKAEIESFLKF
jgi:hypothetical protein